MVVKPDTAARYVGYVGKNIVRSNVYDSILNILGVYKLDIINSALTVADLRSPPGNRLEALRGDFAGFHSIRINAQWRIVFRWSKANADEVRLIDYHR